MRVDDWISKFLREGMCINKETIVTLSDFTLIWGIFEGAECEGNANKAAFESFSKRAASNANIQDLVKLVRFWRLRYVESSCLNDCFKGLNLRGSDAGAIVEQVLLNRPASEREYILALVTIVFRLRNNLFHGLKTINTLDSQRENLNHAILVLQTLMPLSGRYIYLSAAQIPE